MAYKRRKKRGEPVTYKVVTRNPYTGEREEVAVTSKHMWAHEYFSIEDRLIGQVRVGQADPTGENKLKRARLRAKEHVLSIVGADPDDMTEFGGLADADSCARYLEAPGNEDLVYLIDPEYQDALFRTEGAENSPNRGAGDGENAAQARASGPAA